MTLPQTAYKRPAMLFSVSTIDRFFFKSRVASKFSYEYDIRLILEAKQNDQKKARAKKYIDSLNSFNW